MKETLDAYLNSEIPGLVNYSGIQRIIKLMILRRLNPSYDAIYMIRYVYVYSNARGIKKIRKLKYYRLLIHRYGIYFNIESGCMIGKGLFLPHPSSIIIGSGVSIGSNCTIYQNVTIGAKKRGEGIKMAYPQIGDDVNIYSGAVVIGAIKIGKGTQIGANSVVIDNTEENGVYAGIPAVRKR